MESLDFGNEGRISYSNFLTATMSKQEILNKENLRFAFHHFDSDHDGFITAENLYECFTRTGRGIQLDEVLKMMSDAGFDQESKLNFEEFDRFMQTITEANDDLGVDLHHGLDEPMEDAKE